MRSNLILKGNVEDITYILNSLKKIEKVSILCVLGFLFLLGCKEVLKEASQKEEILVSDKVQTYRVPYQMTLDDDLELDFKLYNLVFESGSEIKLQDFDLVVSANEIEFKDNVRIIGFDLHDYNVECESHGRSSGSLILNAKVIKGSPLIDLKGQNSGRHGWGYYVRKNNGKKHHPDDKVIKGFVKNPCTMKHRMHSHKDSNTYWKRVAFNGGDNGSLKVFKDSDISVFSPNLIDSRSHGNLISYISYSTKVRKSTFSHWGATPKGESGASSKFCVFLEGGFEKCFKDFVQLVNEISEIPSIERR